MKTALVLLAFMATSVLGGHDHWEDHAPKGEPRLCPKGYSYVGDDGVKPQTRDYWMEEMDRTPTYSCYKIFKAKALTYLEATEQCQNDEGQLVSLQDTNEKERLQYHFVTEGYYFNEDGNGDDDDDSSEEEDDDDRSQPTPDGPVVILTSALYLEGTWTWFGTENATLNETFEGMDDTTPGLGACLALNMTNDGIKLTRTSCFEPSQFACELRVQTVTYFAWFVANWFSVLLVFLVIVLLLSLCITGAMYSRRPRYAGRVYRGADQQVFDNPPSYSRATGQGPMNRYVNKGRELMAKVYSRDEKTQNPM